MSPMSSPRIAAALAALSLTGVSSTRAANDLLADRQMLPAVPVPYITGYPESLIQGSTASATTEPGEINEAGLPAAATDRSVWYEWTPAETGTAFLYMDYVDRALYPSPTRGLAVYSLAAGNAVTMENLVPEAGSFSDPGNYGPSGVRLRVTAGRKLIIRASTVPYKTVVEGAPFLLVMVVKPSAAPPVAGDTPATALPLKMDRGGRAVYADVFPAGHIQATAETADQLIGGKYYPAGAAQWYRWRGEGIVAGAPAHFSLTDHASPSNTLLVATQAAPGAPLELVTGPAQSVTFTPEPGREYLLRVAMDGMAQTASMTLRLAGAAPEPGDEPAHPRSIDPGVPLVLNFAGAASNPLSATDGSGGRPDIWLDAGSSLSGRYVFKADRRCVVRIYVADAAGLPGKVVTTGNNVEDACFLAEEGHHYLVRVEYLLSRQGGYEIPVSLQPVTIPAPENDRREGAVVLSGEGAETVYGDTAGASAEESDTFGPYADPFGGGRTVWYRLNPPTGSQWYAGIQGAGSLSVYVERPDGALGSFSNFRFTAPGLPLWLMVKAGTSSRFLLQTGPVTAEGDTRETAVPLTAGVTRVLYSGSVTPDSPVPGIPDTTLATQWLSWKATQSGPVVFTLAGSRSNVGNPRVFTAAMEAVEITPWGNPSQVNTVSFQAVAGTSYFIGLSGVAGGISRARLQPGGWESPYDLWRLNFPWMDGEPSLADPLADTDADGVPNLMEMAVGTDPLAAESLGFPFTIAAGASEEETVSFREMASNLRGAEGSHPFSLVLESSLNLKDWTPVPHTVGSAGEFIEYHTWTRPAATTTGTPTGYYRLRVSR